MAHRISWSSNDSANIFWQSDEIVLCVSIRLGISIPEMHVPLSDSQTIRCLMSLLDKMLYGSKASLPEVQENPLPVHRSHVLWLGVHRP